jgi:hypothetical protein
MGVSGMLDIPWFRKEGGRLATGFGPKLRTLRAFKEQSAKKYHMTITIYPDEYEVEGFELLLDLRLGMGFSNSQAMLAVRCQVKTKCPSKIDGGQIEVKLNL